MDPLHVPCYQIPPTSNLTIITTVRDALPFEILRHCSCFGRICWWYRGLLDRQNAITILLDVIWIYVPHNFYWSWDLISSYVLLQQMMARHKTCKNKVPQATFITLTYMRENNYQNPSYKWIHLRTGQRQTTHPPRISPNHVHFQLPSNKCLYRGQHYRRRGLRRYRSSYLYWLHDIGRRRQM